MPPYELFLISNLRYGLEEGLQPWLIPQDAWATLTNAYLRRGVLCKRNGMIEFTRMVHAVADEAIGALGTDHYTGTLAEFPIRVGDLSFTDGTLLLEDDGDGTLSGDGTGTIVYTTGVYDITFSGNTTGAVTADYDFYPGLSLVGIEGYSNLTTTETDLMVFDKRRCGKWDTTNEKLEDTNGVDVWTGGDFDYFWGCNARNYLYVTNNVDRIKRWTGSAWQTLLMDVSLYTAGIVSPTALGIGTTAEKIASTAFQYYINGIVYSKSAVAAGTAFSAADTINVGAAGGSFWGIWAVQINTAGTISTKSPAADQTYANEAAAIVDLPDADTGNVRIGYVTVQSNAGVSWVANTGDLTPTSDCLDSNFYNTAADSLVSVSSCKFLIFYKERIVSLRPFEGGTLHPQRARWCKPEDHTDWTNDGYVDAPTNDWIMACDFIGENLVVWFENSVWRLKYTSDATLPFEWEQIDVTTGCYAPFSGFNYNDVMAAVGATNIVETDNLRVYEIDQKIPDVVIGMDQSQFEKIYSIPIQELQQVLISYPEVDDTENTHSICYNYADKSWSRYDFGFNIYGFYKEGEIGLTLDEIEDTWQEAEYAWDDKTRQAGYPITLGGDVDGYVWKINYGGSDNGSAISFEAFSGRWNPYLKHGKSARFGWIDFYVDRDPNVDMTVTFYAHTGGKEEVVATQTVTFGESGDNADKVWVRADNGAIGDFHRVKLTNNSSDQTIRIHAMKVWMKPAGDMR
jgi:hypothetical protein